MTDTSGRSRAASSSSSSTVDGRQRTAISRRYGSDETDDSQQSSSLLPSSATVAYRGVRGLKHRNDRPQRPPAATAAVLDRPPGKAASERQNVSDRRPSSSDQPRPVSSRRSVSADRQAVSASTTRTLFESLYQQKVMMLRQGYIELDPSHFLISVRRL